MSKRKKMQRQAHHEAGHAVIAWMNGLSVKLLSLRPDEATWSRVEYDPHETFTRDVVPLPQERAAWQAWMKAHAIATLAGPLAVIELTGDDHHGADLTGDMIVATQWVDEGNLDGADCTEEAAQLVGRAWPLIEAVAAELSKRTELTGEEMQEIIQPVLRKLAATATHN